MKVAPTRIDAVLLITPARHEDERGWFAESHQHRRFCEQVEDTVFVQDNESFSARKHTVRGLHCQAPPHAQGKLVRCLHGAILDVAVDARVGSPSYGQWVMEELSAENGRQLWVPKGFLHGFMTLTENCLVSYKVDAYYDRDSERAVRWDDAALAIDWPVAGPAVTVALRDAEAPTFAAFDSPFRY